MKINSHFSAYLSFLVLATSLAQAQSLPIALQAESYLQNYANSIAAKGFRSEYNLGNIDPRLLPEACLDTFEFAFARSPIEYAHATLEITCPALQSWKIYLSTQYRVFAKVITSNQLIPKGAIISNEALSESEAQVNQVRYKTLSDKQYVAGMMAKRSIKPGQIIAPKMLSLPRLIQRGDQVTITAANNSIAIKMTGTALSHGRKGQQIAVRNNQSSRVVKGTVMEPGKVYIAL